MINIIIRTFSSDLRTINIILENNESFTHFFEKIYERLNLTPEKYYFVYNSKPLHYDNLINLNILDIFGNTDLVFLHMYPRLKHFK